jgi:aryl-alcohol dehydrogenase-like predicted oxidoreductase
VFLDEYLSVADTHRDSKRKITMDIPKRTLGKTGVEVTILGLGGEGILRTYGYEEAAYGLINRAIDLGINYFESARAYSGSESYYGSALAERRKEIFLISKSHARDKRGALDHLRETLSNMKTDHLDLWQVHDVRTEEDIAEIFGPGGAIEAFSEAKEKGLTRFVGVTGHQDPVILRRCIETYDFDTVLLPVNPAEPAHLSFIDTVIPLANEKGMGIIGMKVYFRGFASRVPGFDGMGPYFRFALSQPISNAVIGCDNNRQLEENIRFAESFDPMSQEEMSALVDGIAPYAQQLMYYKTW